MKEKLKQSLKCFWGYPIILFILFSSLDQWVKFIIVDWYKQDGYINYPVIDNFFNIVYVTNKGAAWGILSSYTPILALISLIAFFYMLYNFIDFTENKLIYRILGGLMMAGIFGNFIDRAFRSDGVIDMIDIVFGNWHYPTFNIADSCICISMGVYFIDKIFTKKKKSAKKNN